VDGSASYRIATYRAQFAIAWYSQEEITLKVEIKYRLFLAIEMSLYRYKEIISGGCAKFHPLAFFKIQYGRPNPPKSLKQP